MHQLPQDSGEHFPLGTTFTDRIYADETMHPYADFTECDYYDTADMGHKQDNTVTPLSPALSDEELGDWKLNEVFQDLMTMDSNVNTNSKLSGHDEVSLGVDDLFQHQDLLSGAFELHDIPATALPSHYPPAAPLESLAYDDMETNSELVPLPVLECASSDVSASSSLPVPDTARNDCKQAVHKTSYKGKSKVRKAKARAKVSVVDTRTITVKPHETKKDAIRRVKNNAASKVFRSKKKSKLEDLEIEEERFDSENRQLRADLEMVEDVVRVLKERLVHSAKGLCK